MNGNSDTGNPNTERLQCPYCSWESREFDPEHDADRLCREVDAEIHFESGHPNAELPSGYGYGEYQCPECYRMDGMEGCVSCKHCGFIPQEARATEVNDD